MSTSETNVVNAGEGGGGVGASSSTASTTTTGVAAKITHVKTTTIDPSGHVTGSGGNLVTTGAIKLTATVTGSTTGGGTQLTASSISGLNAVSSTATAIRAIGAGGQATQVRVVMPTNLMAPMIKQIESTAVAAVGGRTQITAMPAVVSSARTVPSASITVTRPITQTTYLPRASVPATSMTGIGVGVGVGVATTTTGQRLVTPLRATSATNVSGATVTGLTAGGSFVRSAVTSATVSRNSSPATTVISPATSTTWMAAAGQVQLIRAIPHQQRQRIITTATGSTSGGTPTPVTNVVSAAVVGTATTVGTAANVTSVAATQAPQQQSQAAAVTQPTLQTVVSSAASALTAQQQPTYVATLATVLPPRQHPATLVYSSNVGNVTAAAPAGAATVGTITQTLAQQQTQQFSPTLAAGQRFAVATTLTAAAAAATAGAPRQIRQIPLAKPISTTKLSTASISIRAPNLQQLAPTIATATGVTGAQGVGPVTASTMNTATAAITARSTAITGSTATASVIPGANLSTTRIIQIQQQPGGTAQQIIGSAGRLAGNVMLQPFIVNTSGGSKLGLRPPVTMATKGQPSLTITHMGISKLPTTATATGATIATAAQGVTMATNIQGLSAVAGATNLTTGATTATVGGIVTTPTITSGVSGAAPATGLITAQNIASSTSAVTGGATVVPLAITTRGITSIKSANGITVGKVMTAAAAAVVATGATASPTALPVAEGGNTATNVFIQQQTRPGSAGGVGASAISSTSNTSTVPAIPTSSSPAVTTAITAPFLPPGSTIYYESVPASTVQVSTGVLSITTTTLTSSTMSQQQTSTAATLGIVSSSTPVSSSSTSSTTLPFVTHAAANSPNTGAGARSIGQLQLPISSSSGGIGTTAQIQAVRFSTSADGNSGSVQPQVLMATQIAGPSNTTTGGTAAAPQHMVIPLQTSIKVTTAGTAGATSFLRKRDNGGIIDSSALPMRAAKNLAPTLLAMGSASPTSVSVSVSSTNAMSILAVSTATPLLPPALSPAASTSSSSTSGFSNVKSGNTAQPTSTTAALTVEALAKKERASGLATGTPTRCSRDASPASSEGSTTVSANSSPGVEQQMAQDEKGLLIMQHSIHNRAGDNAHFNPIQELYPNHHQQQHKRFQSLIDGMQQGVATQNLIDNQQNQVEASTSLVTTALPQRINGGIGDGPLRKRSRRGTNDSQQSNQSQPSSTFGLPPPPITGNDFNAMIGCSGGGGVGGNIASSVIQPDDVNSSNSGHALIGQHKMLTTPMTGNKENAKPVEYYLRRPRNCSLINSYKANWKTANNHFQRYTDVKQREERRPTVIDVANQVNIQSKLGGWKVYHLRAQMEDLAENESSSFDKLTEMLKQMETHKKTSDTERICDLLKGNIQRNRIIVDGINDAKNQIMKILDHQSHISEILNRCASKRNFKKRDKV